MLCRIAVEKYSFSFFFFFSLSRRMISYISIPYVRSFFSFILSRSLFLLLLPCRITRCVGRIFFFLPLSVGNNSEKKSLPSIHHHHRRSVFFFFLVVRTDFNGNIFMMMYTRKWASQAFRKRRGANEEKYTRRAEYNIKWEKKRTWMIEEMCRKDDLLDWEKWMFLIDLFELI